MKTIVLATTLAAAACSAFAGPTCTVPKDKWMSEEAFKAKMAADGYTVKTFKVSKGQCYEIYGFDKAGKKVEIYFDPANAAVLEQK
jgi:hypothetical protein